MHWLPLISTWLMMVMSANCGSVPSYIKPRQEEYHHPNPDIKKPDLMYQHSVFRTLLLNQPILIEPVLVKLGKDFEELLTFTIMVKRRLQQIETLSDMQFYMEYGDNRFHTPIYEADADPLELLQRMLSTSSNQKRISINQVRNRAIREKGEITGVTNDLIFQLLLEIGQKRFTYFDAFRALYHKN